jgi:hypothetical protein
MADELNKEVGVTSGYSTDTSRPLEELEGGSPLTEKDIESCRIQSNTQQDTEFNGHGPATRVSTKSSWKDPGPPPDGGLTAWSQGAYSLKLSALEWFECMTLYVQKFCRMWLIKLQLYSAT